jgi:hypothetical protein
MTTATVRFDQPTLFKEGRFSRDDAPAPSREPVAPPSREPVAPPSREPVAPPSREPVAPASREPVAPASREFVAPAPSREPAAAPAAPAPRGRATLDDVLVAVWDGLAAHHSVACPVCSGSMAPRYGSGAQPVGGRCRRCGSTLG